MEDKFEKWNVWRPISNGRCWISIDSMHIVNNELILVYDSRNTQKKISFNFKTGLKAIRFVDEGKLLRSYIPFGEVESNFYKVSNSAYINSLLLNSENKAIEKMNHFVILGSELYIDIIASHEPQVEYI